MSMFASIWRVARETGPADTGIQFLNLQRKLICTLRPGVQCPNEKHEGRDQEKMSNGFSIHGIPHHQQILLRSSIRRATTSEGPMLRRLDLAAGIWSLAVWRPGGTQ